MRTALLLLLASLASIASVPGAARADVVVAAGAAMTLGEGTLSTGCTALRVAGTFRGASGRLAGGDVEIQSGGLLAGDGGLLEVAGDWTNQGTFDAGASTVHFLDGCSNSEAEICDESTFANLVVESLNGKTYRFEAGATQTVLDSLTVAGDSGSLVRVRSKIDGERAFIALRGDQDISFVDVQDHEAVARHIAKGPPEDFDSVDSGNNLRWFLNLDSIPAATPAALLLLALALASAAWWQLRRIS